MWLTLDDLRCSECVAFVHPLLDACPSCGAPRPSRRQEAAAGPIGAARLLEAPETQRLADNLTLRYTIKVNEIRRSEANITLLTTLAHLTEALTYRISGDAVPTADNARLDLRNGGLVAQSQPSGALLAEIPLAAIEGSAAGHGEATLYYAAGASAGAVRPHAGASGVDSLLRLTVANRRGLLASKARDDHFEAFARCIGILAAAAAEQRWTEIGLPAYLAELGLLTEDPAGSVAASGDAQVAGSAPPPLAASRSTVQASLAELESLRAAGLVAPDEYAQKRREILARL